MWSRTPVLAACAALGGCDLVFGVDPPTPIVPHTGTFERQFIFEDATGVVVQRVPFEPSDFAARLFQNSEELPIAWDYATSTFAFEAVENELYRIVLQSPVEATEIQTTHASLALNTALFERPDTDYPTAFTAISGTIMNPQVGNHRLVTTGVWSDLTFGVTPVDPVSASYTILWPDQGLVSTTRHDRVFVVAEEDRGDHRSIGRHATATLDMVSGANMLDSTLAPSTLPLQCTTLTAPLQALDARIEETFPSFVDVTPGWGIYGSPAPEVSLSALLFLAESNGAIAQAQVELVDPYGLPQIALANATRGRLLATGDATQILAFATIRQYSPVASAACPTSPATDIPAGTLGLPARFALAGTALDYEGYAPISLAGTTEVELTWEAEGGEFHGIVIYDVTDIADYTRPVRKFLTTEPRAVIESALLVDGHRYIAIVQTNRGYVDAANGNFVDIGEPFGAAIVTSPVFEVKR